MTDSAAVPQSTIPNMSSPPRGADIVERELDRNAAVLPPIPAIMARLQAELSSEWVNTTRLANLVRTDPALDAMVLKVANSPYWRGTREIHDVEEAVQRLGKDNLRSLATVLVMQNGAFPTTGLLKGTMHDFWRHALLVASGAVQIFRKSAQAHDAMEQVWTAALFHDLGALFMPMLFSHEWEVLEERVSSAAPSVQNISPLFLMERDVLGTDHAMVGGVFAKKFWKLPESVAVLIGYWTDAASVVPPEAAWAIRRADDAAQAHGVCWQPFVTRVHELEPLDEDTGAGAACDPDFCMEAVEKNLALVDALIS